MSKLEKPDPVPENDLDPEESSGQDEVPAEHGGPKGKEPTRYGDWEKNGRCIDF
ncbi:MAG TPA: DUF1674 domain-containing protein [Gammaproteobacteria bacterium]|nr:DUF1674 domain-containing protein [Gammaproteobacteria bacterium]